MPDAGRRRKNGRKKGKHCKRRNVAYTGETVRDSMMREREREERGKGKMELERQESVC